MIYQQPISATTANNMLSNDITSLLSTMDHIKLSSPYQHHRLQQPQHQLQSQQQQQQRSPQHSPMNASCDDEEVTNDENNATNHHNKKTVRFDLSSSCHDDNIRIPHHPQVEDRKSPSSSPLPAMKTTPSPSSMRILRKRHRLWQLYHAATCQETNTTTSSCCSYSFCSNMKQLWNHIEHCYDDTCGISHCYSSRLLLSHHLTCRHQNKCPICRPVRRIMDESSRINSRQKHHHATAVPCSSSSSSLSNNSVGVFHIDHANATTTIPEEIM